MWIDLVAAVVWGLALWLALGLPVGLGIGAAIYEADRRSSPAFDHRSDPSR